MATKQRLILGEHTAKAKIRALAQGVQVWKLEGGGTPRYAVPSSTMEGAAYEVVVLSTGDIICNCPGNRYRAICKHAGAIMLRQGLETEMELASPAATEDRHEAAVNDNLKRDLADLYP